MVKKKKEKEVELDIKAISEIADEARRFKYMSKIKDLLACIKEVNQWLFEDQYDTNRPNLLYSLGELNGTAQAIKKELGIDD